MKRWLAAGLAVAVWSGVGSAEPRPGRGVPTPNRSRPKISVRVYDGTRIADRTRKEAVTRTRRLLDSAGLSSAFHDCSPGVTASATLCATSPLPGDLIIRMVL